MTQPSIFISYSRQDEAEKNRLLSHLGVLQNAGLMSVWSDDRIGAGAEWEGEIDRAIAQAQVAILLVSANYLTSDFILREEVPALLKRRQDEGLVIFPIIATACAWRMVDWLARMQVRPKSGRPVWSDSGSHVNEDLTDIAEEVAQIVTGAGQPSHQNDSDTKILDAPVQMLDDRDWESLLYRIRSGKCTPFIGPEVIHQFIRPEHELARAWAQEHHYPLEDRHNLARVAQYLAIKRDPAFPVDELVRHLEGISTYPNFNDPDEPHSFFASLPLSLYITTNYDDFLMQALGHHARNAHQEVCHWNRYVRDIPSIFDPESDVTVSPANPVVYHLFGHANLPESMVLTEDDYLDFLVNISRNQSVIPRQIEKALVKTSLLFVGYQLTDIRFRILFRGLVTSLQRSLRHTSIAVQLSPQTPDGAHVTEADIRAYLEEYMAKDDVRVYWGDSFEFVKELRTRWEAFHDRH